MGLARFNLTRTWVFATAGLGAGFSGLAIITMILTGWPLLLAEGILVSIPIGAAAFIFWQAPRSVIREVWPVVRAGVLAGALATLMYDVTRTVLGVLDPSPYDPFGAIRQFGLGVVPASSPAAVVMAAGLAVHFLNGSTFGVIYATLGGRHIASKRGAALAGLAWAMTLYLIQSALYPGWLHITTWFNEFETIAGLGHVAFGVALGLGVRWLLRRDAQREERP